MLLPRGSKAPARHPLRICGRDGLRLNIRTARCCRSALDDAIPGNVLRSFEIQVAQLRMSPKRDFGLAILPPLIRLTQMDFLPHQGVLLAAVMKSRHAAI